MVGIVSTSSWPAVLPLPPLFLADIRIAVAPAAILVLCVIAAVGTLLLLPAKNRPDGSVLGGLLVTAAAVILAVIMIHSAAGDDLSGTGPYFWIFSAIALFGAVRVITHPRPVYSALYFVLTVFASAGLFILMCAEFMAAALVLIYAGAILITYVFVIMLAASAQNPGDNRPLAGLAECDLVSRDPFTAAIIGFAMMGVLLFVIFDRAESVPFALPTSTNTIMPEEQVHGSTQSVGQYLFTEQMVNLELAGLILTVSMVGAIVIARRKVTTLDDRFEPTSEVISGPATPVSDDPKSIPVYGTTNPKQKAFPQN
jgi:NADH-quinone oxidoreductase subunit J